MYELYNYDFLVPPSPQKNWCDAVMMF